MREFTPRLNAKVEWAIETNGGDSQKFDIVFEPGLELELHGQLRFTALGRVRTDLIGDLEPGRPAQSSVARPTRRWWPIDRTEAEIRELYVDVPINKWLIRAGKQQVVWGQADGLKVLDLVNPQSFREFILADFEDSRTPLWMVNLEGPFVFGMDLQLLWIPDTSAHELPESGAPFAFTLPSVTGVDVIIEEPDLPRDYLKDSDAGVRLSGFWGGWDLGFYYLYHYNDFPTISRSFAASLTGPQLRISPKYERTHVAGGSVSNAFGDFTLRGEIGYSTDRFFSVDDFNDFDGLARLGELSYVFGVDWSGLPETFVSMQIFQSMVDADPTGLRRQRFETSASLLVRREFMNDSLVFSLLWLHGVNQSDGLVRSRLEYDVDDSVNVWIGFDVFYGNKDGLFGQFDPLDRMVVGFEWNYQG